MTKVAFTNEIGGAFLSDGGDMSALLSDPKGYIFSQFSLDFGDSSVSVVENSADSMHLVLPYYSAIEGLSSSAMSDDDLDEVAGGEIFISALLITGAVVGTAAAVAGTGAYVGLWIKDKVDKSKDK